MIMTNYKSSILVKRPWDLRNQQFHPTVVYYPIKELKKNIIYCSFELKISIHFYFA